LDRPEPTPRAPAAPAATETNEPVPLHPRSADTNPAPSSPAPRDSQAPTNPEPVAHAAPADEAARKPSDRAAPSAAEPAAAPAAQASPERPVATTTPITHPATTDANASAGLTASANATPPAVNAAPAAASAQIAAPYTVPVAGLAVEIVARARDGQNRFEIRLDPPELGRVDVHLRVDRDGNVSSRLIVERSETLDLLRRDAPSLERALQNAGLKTGEQGLQFSLRDQMLGREHNDRQAPSGAARVVIADDEAQPSAAARNGYGRLIGLGAGIDIRV
jgi:flagellar hook-length control protein FliK